MKNTTLTNNVYVEDCLVQGPTTFKLTVNIRLNCKDISHLLHSVGISK